MRIATIAALMASACSGGETPRRAEASPSGSNELAVARGSFERQVVLSGSLDALDAVELVVPQTDTWQQTISYLVDDGTAVAAGDRVVEFDSASFASQLESQRVLVNSARREFEIQRHLRGMEIADKEHAVSVAELERAKAALYAGIDDDLVSERDAQERQLVLDRADAALVDARSDLISARRAADLDLELKRVARDKAERDLGAAEASIAALTLRAPQPGVVMVGEHRWIGEKMRAGDTVQPGWVVARLPDLRKLVVKARLSDVDDRLLTIGMRAEIVFDANQAERASGRVEDISAVAGELYEDSLLRAFDVIVSVEEAGGEWVRPGMSVRVEVTANEIADAILVPRRAIEWADDAPRVVTDQGVVIPLDVVDCNANECALAADSMAPPAVGAALRPSGARR